MQGPINLAQLKQTHERFKRHHALIVDRSMAKAGNHAKEHVRLRSKFKRRSRRSLKDNTKARIVRTSGGKILRLKWTKKYASYVEYGTKKHPISLMEEGGGTSTRGKALRFFWKKGPNGPGIYFFKKVNHPGTRPYKFGWNSASAAHRIMGQQLRSGMQRAAEKF